MCKVRFSVISEEDHPLRHLVFIAQSIRTKPLNNCLHETFLTSTNTVTYSIRLRRIYNKDAPETVYSELMLWIQL